jgi:hypothetical protein
MNAYSLCHSVNDKGRQLRPLPTSGRLTRSCYVLTIDHQAEPLRRGED